MAIWTDLTNFNLGKTISAAEWNIIFGPDGNMQYLKDRSDQIVFDYYYDYTSGVIRVPSGWPQGNADNVASTGTVSYPIWLVSGVPTSRYITLQGPGKYLCVLQVDANAVYGWLKQIRYSTIKTIVTDTLGNLNFTHLQQMGYQTELTFIGGNLTQDVKYQVPFVFDAPFDSDLIIGFARQRNFETALYDDTTISFNLSAKLMIHKISTYQEVPNVSTSFILNTTTLNGTSSF